MHGRPRLGTETTGGIVFILPVGGWTARGFLGRNEPDPLTLAEPGGGSGGILIGRRLVGSDPFPLAKPPLHQVLEYSDRGATVEIHVDPPRETLAAGNHRRLHPLGARSDGQGRGPLVSSNRGSNGNSSFRIPGRRGVVSSPKTPLTRFPTNGDEGTQRL